MPQNIFQMAREESNAIYKGNGENKSSKVSEYLFFSLQVYLTVVDLVDIEMFI